MNFKKVIVSLLVLALLITPSFVSKAVAPFDGKIIALDAGHGNGATGAVNERVLKSDGTPITEAEVNWDVVQALKTKLETSYGAHVVVAERYSARRDRVNDAVAKCAALDVTGDGVADNKKCDVLVSVHHNGSADPAHDGTLTIYTQKSDQPLAKSLLDALWPLTGKNEGMLNGGYGMTVYKNIVSAITEAYYITNDDEARLWLSGARTPREVDAQIAGLSSYFSAQSGRGK